MGSNVVSTFSSSPEAAFSLVGVRVAVIGISFRGAGAAGLLSSAAETWDDDAAPQPFDQLLLAGMTIHLLCGLDGGGGHSGSRDMWRCATTLQEDSIDFQRIDPTRPS
ncbi:hypothetical protein OPV22_016102 [Ensete ventricosum]|uniref:Uncharacterized protein n=1 Tax=Ensete ventricosum TaxID=4639 RepID=A0AAV8QP48_ENSVE|nr:hypothetical protein OPV22_016102 [Ensete ventricosum]